jgi:Fe-S-cluster containining protein
MQIHVINWVFREIGEKRRNYIERITMTTRNQDLSMEEIESTLQQLEPVMHQAYDGLGKGPVTPQVVKFYKRFDELTSASKLPISCKAGCSYCCHYHVMITATEAFAITEALAKMTAAERQVIQDRIRITAERASTLTRDEYLRTNVECAMLVDGKNCSVYQVRPIACRGHHSADVSICKETFDDVNSPALAPKDRVRELFFRVFENGQLLENHRAGVDTTKYEMHAALLEAISNPAAAKRWRAGKSAFPGVRDKVTLAEMMNGA